MTQNSKQQYKNTIRRNERKSVLLPSRKTLQFISNVFFGFEKKKKTKKQNQRKENSKKGTETFLTYFLKMPDENLSKEKVDFLITFFQTGR